MPAFFAVIPARHASTRLPGKPLADINGKAMVVRVAERAAASGAAGVWVATDHEGVAAAVLAAGFAAVMTSPDCASGSDRLAEVAQRLGWPDDTVVVNVQGDEPLIDPALIQATAMALFAHPDAAMSTVCHPIHDAAEAFNPNVVKVVTDKDGYALYFSRAPIPAVEPPPFTPGLWLKQVCVISFRRHWLQRFAALPQGPLERMESIDMLRLLEHGIAVRVVSTDVPTHAVDTPADLALVDSLMAARRLSRDDDAAR